MTVILVLVLGWWRFSWCSARRSAGRGGGKPVICAAFMLSANGRVRHGKRPNCPARSVAVARQCVPWAGRPAEGTMRESDLNRGARYREVVAGVLLCTAL